MRKHVGLHAILIIFVTASGCDPLSSMADSEGDTLGPVITYDEALIMRTSNAKGGKYRVKIDGQRVRFGYKVDKNKVDGIDNGRKFETIAVSVNNISNEVSSYNGTVSNTDEEPMLECTTWYLVWQYSDGSIEWPPLSSWEVCTSVSEDDTSNGPPPPASPDSTYIEEAPPEWNVYNDLTVMFAGSSGNKKVFIVKDEAFTAIEGDYTGWTSVYVQSDIGKDNSQIWTSTDPHTTGYMRKTSAAVGTELSQVLMAGTYTFTSTSQHHMRWGYFHRYPAPTTFLHRTRFLNTDLGE